MPRTKQTPQVRTRLAKTDYERFRLLLRAKSVKEAQLAREAILFYLDNQDSGGQMEPFAEALLAQQKKGFNRVAGLLAKIGIDMGTFSRFFWDSLDDDERDHWAECYGKAVKRMNARATSDEKTVADHLEP